MRTSNTRYLPKVWQLALCLAATVTLSSSAFAQNLTSNGDFETGNTSGWQNFTNPPQTFLALPGGPAGSTFFGQINNTTLASAAVVKQANLGIGTVLPNEVINITFDARGTGAVGGVAFAELFSEIGGGGVSSSLILGGGPLMLDPINWTSFSFSPTTGADVSGGITLQFNAVTGGATGSTSLFEFDNVSITRAQAIPEPGSLGALALSAVGLIARRRRR